MEQMSKELLMARLGFAQLRKAVPVLWNDQEMHWRLGVDVSEGQSGVILINDLGWDLLRDNLFEDGGSALFCGLRSSASRIRQYELDLSPVLDKWRECSIGAQVYLYICKRFASVQESLLVQIRMNSITNPRYKALMGEMASTAMLSALRQARSLGIQDETEPLIQSLTKSHPEAAASWAAWASETMALVI